MTLLALAAIACTDGVAPLEGAPAPPVGCVDTCPGGLTCTSGACVGAEPPRYDVVLRVRPRADSASAMVEIHGLDFKGAPVLAPARSVSLPDVAAIAGRVFFERARAIGVAAEVSALAEDALVLPAPGATTTTVATDDSQRFTLNLAPAWPTLDESLQCVGFRLRVLPDRATLPPYDQAGVRFGACGGTQNVALPDLAPDRPLIDYCLTPGLAPQADDVQILCGQVVVSETNPTPVQVQVHAQDETRRPISTLGQTDANGNFALAFWRAEVVRTVRLRVEPVSPRERPLPSVEQAVRLEPASARNPQGLGDEGAPQIHYLGEFGQTFVQRGRVVGLRGDAEEPLVGATVRFRGSVGNGRFETQVGTGRDGAFEVNLYAAEYLVDVDPGATEYRLLRSRVTLRPDGDGLALALRPRTPLTGRAVGPGDSLLAGAAVEARLLRARYADPTLESEGEVAPAREDGTRTDEAGRFTLRLDPGDHLITVRPAPETGLPRLVLRRTVPSDQPVDVGRLDVPSAGLIALTLQNESGTAVESARVEAWALPELGHPVLVGEGRSDAAGFVTVRVPSGRAPAVAGP